LKTKIPNFPDPNGLTLSFSVRKHEHHSLQTVPRRSLDALGWWTANIRTQMGGSSRLVDRGGLTEQYRRYRTLARYGKTSGHQSLLISLLRPPAWIHSAFGEQFGVMDRVE
jgi:hypothetical protein